MPNVVARTCRLGGFLGRLGSLLGSSSGPLGDATGPPCASPMAREGTDAVPTGSPEGSKRCPYKAHTCSASRPAPLHEHRFTRKNTQASPTLERTICAKGSLPINHLPASRRSRSDTRAAARGCTAAA
eukprot:3390175-Pyramimonas_sp.AAC.1